MYAVNISGYHWIKWEHTILDETYKQSRRQLINSLRLHLKILSTSLPLSMLLSICTPQQKFGASTVHNVKVHK